MLDRLHITAALAAMVAIPLLGADLSIEVRGVRSADGRVYVAVHGPESKDTFPSGDTVSGLREPARIGTLRFVVSDLPAGRYAVNAFHDENDNGDPRSFLRMTEKIRSSCVMSL